ncbi:DUF305 domain-containing protein [Aeromicrobium sp. CTD01-1L150]|uniref:DUF305 domain-containing protein n=1 Tax=Aeromicrobium sp. CTD01-1L150 TaxID=3341830 RepID=UPI0035C25E7C
MSRGRLLTLGVALAGLGVAVGWFAGLLVHGDGHEQHEAQEPAAADIGFSQDMVVHHEQAVEMARIVQGRVEGRVGVLAASILEVQTREVGIMRGWLDLWGASQVAGEPMAWMDGEHAGHGEESSGDAPMPGLASVSEMQSLDDLTGEELEVQFLQLMLRHHEGGIEMAEHGSRMASVDAVSALARSMSVEQQQESELIVQLLAERGADPELDPS